MLRGSRNTSNTSLLDTIDEVRSILSALGSNDTAFYEKIMESMPQFVAVGPQSAGKSSVMRRVSGIPLPEASTLCTRMATELQMRRATQPHIRVVLRGPGGGELKSIPCESETCVAQAVSQAQSDAMQSCPGKAFVDDHVVVVEVRGPNRPNVTLVDLPGFHTANDEDTKTVNEMVSKYIRMSGTLALHVVKGDQDFASVLGNDYLRQVGALRRVTVLTHCDKLSESCEDDVSRLRTTLRTLEKNKTSSMVAAVQGCAHDDEEEMKALQHVQRMHIGIEVGAPKVNSHLEERMRCHLEEQFPLAVEDVERALSTTERELEDLQEMTPVKVLMELQNVIWSNFDAARPKLENEIRKLAMEKMGRKFKTIRLQPMTGVTPSISPYKKALRVGDTVYIKTEKGWQMVDIDAIGESYHSDPDEDEDEPSSRPICVRDNQNPSTGPWIEYISDHAVADPCPPASQYKNYCQDHSLEEDEDVRQREPVQAYSCDVTDECMIKDIRRLIHDRGLRNEVFADRHPVVVQYAAQFARHYTEVVQETALQVRKVITETFDDVFSCKVPEISQKAAARLRKRVKKVEADAEAEMAKEISRLKAENTDTSLVFTTNEHYLHNLMQKMIAERGKSTSDEDGLLHILDSARAYLKVERKHVHEAAAKRMVIILYKEVEKNFGEVMRNDLSKLEALIQEPESRARQRKTLMKRNDVLKRAIEKLRECE